MKGWIQCTIGITILLLLFITTANAGSRRNIEGWMNEGVYNHFTLLDPGECDANGCVMYEKEIAGWDGKNWIHQFVDTNGNDVCDERRIWKPLVDPKWGTYYTLHSTKTCGDSI